MTDLERYALAVLDGKIVAQSYMVWVRNYYGKADMTFAHRGGYYVAKTECFGAGVMY